MRRVFWAIPVEERVSKSIDAWLEATWPGQRRCIPAAKRHLTVCFLGDIEDTAVAGLATALHELLERNNPGEFRVCVAGIGCFPSLRNARVLWAGVHEPSGALHVLHETVALAMESCGIPREARSFHPHITLARLKKPLTSAETACITGAAATIFDASMLVQEIVLFASELKPEGAVYTPLVRVRL